MKRRNLFTIGFLLIASMTVLAMFGWGATEEKTAETFTGAIMGTTNEMKADDTYNDPLEGKSEQSRLEQKQESEEQQQEELKQQNVKDDSSVATRTTIKKALVLTKALNVRKKAKKDATVILILERGMEVELLYEYEDGWTKILYEGKEGYVYSEYIKPID